MRRESPFGAGCLDVEGQLLLLGSAWASILFLHRPRTLTSHRHRSFQIHRSPGSLSMLKPFPKWVGLTSTCSQLNPVTKSSEEEKVASSRNWCSLSLGQVLSSEENLQMSTNSPRIGICIIFNFFIISYNCLLSWLFLFNCSFAGVLKQNYYSQQQEKLKRN